MDLRDGASAPRAASEVGDLGTARHSGVPGRVGLRVEPRTEPRGRVELAPLTEHLLSVHVGPSARMTCHVRQRYSSGDATLLPAGFSGSWVEEEPRRSLTVRLAPALLRLAAEDLGLPPERAGLTPQHRFRDARIEHIVHALEADRTAARPNGRLYTEGLGLALAVHLLNHYPAPREVRGQLSARQSRQVTDYIESHLDKNLSLARLARLAEVSTSHFRTLFKRSLGMPVHQYVILRRVERARALLQEGTLPISQVALEAGFSHQSHLARCMRRVLGVTPKALARGER
ncbi:helix-turn-helix domain-containing protein [Myxococcus sp. CA039A]|uniref:helix-turn-helix domain-containing protein n=1 Tax=Myxococcus sp. CA039A TaxID=2741737 RepID=UPI00157B9892|nr:AraC family transcriptional regulator [Myxococcus sp. CA039A]NTX49998.1 helix-turn-helix transcriptional regulator [Myxococcus sp. CA039A]